MRSTRLISADEAGKPLDGASKYTIHFEKGATPPVNAFWSITLYDQEGFQMANSLNRFAVSSWMPFKYNADGSLDLYFQNESPGKDKEANWLPAPKGAFNLTMRLYGPKSDALDRQMEPTADHTGAGTSRPGCSIAPCSGCRLCGPLRGCGWPMKRWRVIPKKLQAFSHRARSKRSERQRSIRDGRRGAGAGFPVRTVAKLATMIST